MILSPQPGHWVVLASEPPATAIGRLIEFDPATHRWLFGLTGSFNNPHFKLAWWVENDAFFLVAPWSEHDVERARSLATNPNAKLNMVVDDVLAIN